MADPAETTQVSGVPSGPEEQELLAAVRALAAQVGGLQAELAALRSRSSSLPSGDGEQPGWQEAPGSLRDGGAWVRSVDAPSSGRIAIPWLVLELFFLVAVAVLAAVAGLDPPVIAGLMAVSWLVVVAAEWAATRAAERRNALVSVGYAHVPPTLPDDPSWLEPPSERTSHDGSAITRLPPPAAE